MPREPHAWLHEVVDAPHGGVGGEGLLDLSASIAPLGPSPAAIAAARAAPIDRYPSRRAGTLVRAVAAELGGDESRVVAGPGAADLLLRVALAHLSPGDTAVVVAPCFGEYARAALACGANVVTWTASAGNGFALDVDAAAALCHRTGAAVGFLARPGNPTGVPVPVEQLLSLIAATPDTTWAVDEAFLDFCDDRRSGAGGDAVVLRSLTKDLALPGLRVAAVDAPPRVADAIRALTPPWCVSTAGIAAAVAGLADTAHREATRGASTKGRIALENALQGLGLRTTEAAANYVCVEVGDDAGAGEAIAREGVRVRPCSDLGLPGWIRVAVPHPDDLPRTTAALTAALQRARR
ncbi:MAG TPA: histidinol-phosphate transaminase [Candidatus Dormibacteraeota bacterium]|nr:histidinol-phosphate transaminase [Candidatus Dormibacteraeota bacterium]